jgi:hypothetical protein
MRGWKIKPDFIARDLLEATDIINERNLARSRKRKRRALTVKSTLNRPAKRNLSSDP